MFQDVHNQTRYEYQRKPRRCPACGSGRIATILWGYPAFSEELHHDLAEGRLTLGGCCVTDDDPTWQCTDCETEFYKKFDGGKFEHN